MVNALAAAASRGGAASPSASSSSSAAAAEFRSLVASADRKFGRVRDLPVHLRSPHLLHYYRKVFKSYTRLWRFQQDRRRDLLASGLRRREIGEIASRIGQLYYHQYLRTSEVRFLLESYVFYEAILNRGYFEARGEEGAQDLGLRCKELRFFARFIVVAMLLGRRDVVGVLVERFKRLLVESKAAFPGTSFREWKQMLQEIIKFLKADTTLTNTRPFRYSVLFDSHPSSVPYITRFHANRVLRLQDALLTSYHRNEVKFAELTLDTYRMMQCLEWEPSGSFYQLPTTEISETGTSSDHSGASGLIDVNLSSDMTDPTLPPNPRKAVLYHPSVSHIISVLGTISEELSSDSILLVYISASGKDDHDVAFQKDNNRTSLNSLKVNPDLQRLGSSECSGSYLWLGSRGNGGLNNLYPEDIIPFTRKPLFLIIDSDSSHSFKAIHGAERGETAALLLSPRRRSSICSKDPPPNESQFTYFLTAPLLAFLQLVGLSPDIDLDARNNGETILSSAFAEWEVILCTSNSLDLVWAQVISDQFLRRLILRFIFCRAVLSLFSSSENESQRLPDCLPNLPGSVSASSAATQSCVLQLAENFGVVHHFQHR